MAGNIQRRPDGKWRARYRDANHREHARHFPRERDAEQWLASQEVAIVRGEWVDPTLSKITVGEWLPRWLALQVQLKPTTMVRYEVALRRQILPRWELVPLSRITHSDVSSWVHGLTDEGLAPATAWYAHRVLSLALTAAVVCALGMFIVWSATMSPTDRSEAECDVRSSSLVGAAP